MSSGWIKSYRQLLDNPVVCKDADHFAVWHYILLSATHKPIPVMFGGSKITLQPGQLITGRKTIAEKFSIDESKVTRILKSFENEQQIEQQTSNKNRIITVLSWSKYQDGEQQDEQQMNNKRTTDEQQVNTNKKLRTKEVNNGLEKDIKDIVLFLNQKTGKKYSDKTEATKKAINARLKDGFTVDDFKMVIEIKTAEWLNDPKMNKYLCPDTLFRPGNFEKYLNQGVAKNEVDRGSAESPYAGYDFGF